MSITGEMVEGSDHQALSKLAADPSQPGSVAALWMLLLLRLTSVSTDQRLELRNGGSQSVMLKRCIPNFTQAPFRHSCG